MIVLVTRPAAQAAEWVAHLEQQGVAARALPLLEIAAVADAAPVTDAWQRLGSYRLAVFVSPNAAETFFARRPPALAWPERLRAGSTGPGTTRMLLGLGLQAGQIVAAPDDSPQFDSEALWARLADEAWAGARVLIVRGDGGRDWLAQQLVARGAGVDFVSAYQRRTPAWQATEQALLARAQAEPQGHLWLFSSSEAIDHLAELAPQSPVPAARALATHPRIAERARRAGFAEVRECRPEPAAVVACIESMRP